MTTYKCQGREAEGKAEPTLGDVLDQVTALRRIVERHLPDAVSTKAEREQRASLDRKRRAAAEQIAEKAAAKVRGKK